MTLTDDQALMLMERVDILFLELCDAGIPSMMVANEMMARGWASTFMCDADTAREKVAEFYTEFAKAAIKEAARLGTNRSARRAANSNERHHPR